MVIKTRIAELSSGAPWVRKFGYSCMRDRTPFRPSTRSSVRTTGNQCEMICFPVSRLQPEFNMMINVDVMVILATRTFRKRKTTTTATKPSLNRERARARDKTKNRNKKKQSNLKMELINFSGQYGEDERQ